MRSAAFQLPIATFGVISFPQGPLVNSGPDGLVCGALRHARVERSSAGLGIIWWSPEADAPVALPRYATREGQGVDIISRLNPRNACAVLPLIDTARH